MTPFEFFMGFYGLLLGLGLAELLLGFARFARARSRPVLGLLTPAVGALILIQIVTSLMDAWLKLQAVEIRLEQLLLPLLIGLAYFFAASVVVPDDHADWPILDDYFFARRSWTVGLSLAVFILTIAIEVPRIGEHIRMGDGPWIAKYVIVNALIAALLLVALRSRRRMLVLIALLANTALLATLYSSIVHYFW